MSRRRSGGGGTTKADLVDAVYRRHGGLTKAEAANIVDAMFSTMKATLVDGRPVRLKNFGVFEVQDRPPRRGVDPSTGEHITIPSQKGLNFRPARSLREKVLDEESIADRRDDDR